MIELDESDVFEITDNIYRKFWLFQVVMLSVKRLQKLQEVPYYVYYSWA